jgi:transposase
MGGGQGACIDHDCDPHSALIRDERPADQEPHQPRRWVVGRTLAWLSPCRAILMRWDKQACKHQGLLTLACIPRWFRRYHRLSGLG